MRLRGLAARLALPLNHLPVVSRGVPLGPPDPLQVLARAPHRYARVPLRIHVNVSYACFSCGSTGHIKANCPELHRPPTPAEPTRASGPLPVSYINVEELRPTVPVEVSMELAEHYGSQIRAAMGWGRGAAESRLQALAMEQLKESRATRWT